MTEHDPLERRVRRGLAVLAEAVPVRGDAAPVASDSAWMRGGGEPLVGAAAPVLGGGEPPAAGDTARVRGGGEPLVVGVTAPVRAAVVVPMLGGVPGPRRRGGWFVPAAVAAGVVLVLLGAVAGAGSWRATLAPARSGGPATVPRELTAGNSLLTASVRQSPGGRASVVVTNEFDKIGGFFEYGQTAVIGAYRNTYRTLGDGDVHRSPRLSRDGRRLAVGTSTGTVRLLDLETGAERRISLPRRSGETVVLGFSPDGRHVVAGTAADSEDSVGSVETASLLDLDTGEVVPLVEGAYSVAFSPDGSRIAVQTKTKILIVDHRGRPHGELRTPNGSMVGDGAWSPDGRFIAVVEPDASGDNSWPWPPDTIRFLPVDSATPVAEIPRPIRAYVYNVLGWASSEKVVVSERKHPADQLTVWNLKTGERKVLAESHMIGGVNSAALDLLPELATRPTGFADHGPWPTWLVVPLLVVSLAILLLVVGVARSRRRRGAKVRFL